MFGRKKLLNENAELKKQIKNLERELDDTKRQLTYKKIELDLAEIQLSISDSNSLHKIKHEIERGEIND